MIPISHFLVLGAILFCIGLAIVLVKKNQIVILIGIELMLNATNINLVTFDRLFQNPQAEGQLFGLFVIVVAAAEIAVALAIIIQVNRYYQTLNIDQVNKLKG